LLAALIGDARLDASAIKNISADMTAVEIRDALATLTGTSRLDASAVKNLPDVSQAKVYGFAYYHNGVSGLDSKVHIASTPLAGGSGTTELTLYIKDTTTYNVGGYQDYLVSYALFKQVTDGLLSRIEALENA